MTTCGECSAPILWAVTERRKAMALDVEPDPAGTVVLTGSTAINDAGRSGPGCRTIGPSGLFEDDYVRYVPHTATCGKPRPPISDPADIESVPISDPSDIESVRFNGSDYVPERDDARLSGQFARIVDVMRDGAWRTLDEIAILAAAPAASVSAQLRHLRKPRFGAHRVEKRHRGDPASGLYEYCVTLNEER